MSLRTRPTGSCDLKEKPLWKPSGDPSQRGQWRVPECGRGEPGVRQRQLGSEGLPVRTLPVRTAPPGGAATWAGLRRGRGQELRPAPRSGDTTGLVRHRDNSGEKSAQPRDGAPEATEGSVARHRGVKVTRRDASAGRGVWVAGASRPPCVACAYAAPRSTSEIGDNSNGPEGHGL